MSTNVLIHPVKPLLITVSILLLASCATTNKSSEKIASSSTEHNATSISAGETAYITDRNFTRDSLYSLLVAEMAIDRKRYDIALDNYTHEALATRDINIVSRATQIAHALKARQPSLELVSLWSELEPENTQAEQMLTTALVHAGQTNEAYNRSVQLLKQGLNAPFDAIAAKVTNGDISKVVALETQYQTLVRQYPNVDTLQLGHSFLLQKLEHYEDALTAAIKARKLNPHQLQIGVNEVKILEKLGKNAQAQERMAKLVEQNPNNIGLRARFARKLANTNLEESQKQFEILHQQAPNNGEILLSLALVTKQRGLLEISAQYFTTLIRKNQHQSLSHYHLADIYRIGKDYDNAIIHYQQVSAGDDYIDASISAARLLASHRSLEAAITFIQQRSASTSFENKARLSLIHAELLSQTGQLSAAEKILSEGIKTYPNSTNLLYSRAMIYVQIDYIEAAEKDLKKIIELAPNNAAAFNALGYTLADKTLRLKEALTYINKAYKIAPKDPAVLDSMGWIQYRLGNSSQAVIFLQQAMNLMPDHEIAAHLGEVLWQLGKAEDAKKVWKNGFKLKPNSKILHSTLHRLEVTLD